MHDPLVKQKFGTDLSIPREHQDIRRDIGGQETMEAMSIRN